MSKYIGHSEINIFDPNCVVHFDENKNIVGTTVNAFLSGKIHYNSNRDKVGHSNVAAAGSFVNYDIDNNIVGRTQPGLFSRIDYFDSDNKLIAHSEKGFGNSFVHYSDSDIDSILDILLFL